MLGEGALSLATVRLLASHLTAENHQELLAAAAGKSKRQVEELLVRYFPQPDVPDSVRKLPAAKAWYYARWRRQPLRRTDDPRLRLVFPMVSSLRLRLAWLQHCQRRRHADRS
jgi:hypothetical protein